LGKAEGNCVALVSLLENDWLGHVPLAFCVSLALRFTQVRCFAAALSANTSALPLSLEK